MKSPKKSSKTYKQEKIADKIQTYTQSQTTITETSAQQMCVSFQKIIAPKPQVLDIEAILLDYSDNRSKAQKEKEKNKLSKEKEKPKQASSQAQKTHKLTRSKSKELTKRSTTPEQKLSPALSSRKLTNNTQQIYQKFKQNICRQNSSTMNDLQLYTSKQMLKLAKQLCLGLDEIFNQYSNEFLEINKQDLLHLVTDRVIKISDQLFERFNNNKLTSPSIVLMSQWKYVIDLVAKKENNKVRNAILTNQITPFMVATMQQTALFQFLPKERQEQIKAETQKILKEAEKTKLGILESFQETHNQDSDFQKILNKVQQLKSSKMHQNKQFRNEGPDCQDKNKQILAVRAHKSRSPPKKSKQQMLQSKEASKKKRKLTKNC